MKPFLALNCLLQIEQERPEEDSSVGDTLALTAAHISAQLCWFFLLHFLQHPFL